MKYFLSFWKNTFNYKDTATRKDYWFAQLFTIIIELVLLLLSIALVNASDLVLGLVVYPMLYYPIITIIPTISLIVRRLRDAGYSPWLTLLGILPAINVIVFIIVGFIPTKAKEEQ